MVEEILKRETQEALSELLDKAALLPGSILVVGCSSSEIVGEAIGSGSNYEAAEAVFSVIYEEVQRRRIYLAAQCCEHLNRALVIEREAARGEEIVNAVPQPKAGGSFATCAYRNFRDPVLVEHIRADAGLDIGGTLIGMHLKAVAVPLRLSVKTIGKAALTAARTRPRFIGGSRAVYDERLL